MGFLNAGCIERIHRKFLKYLLNVKISTNNYATYKELGRYHLSIERYVRIIEYWFKLINISDSNCILNAVYNSMLLETQKAPRQESWLNKVNIYSTETGSLMYGTTLIPKKRKHFYQFLNKGLLTTSLVN